MTALVTDRPKVDIVYPDCDGEPLAENTLQFEWIVTLKGGLDHVFTDDPNVFVAGDLLWYPVEGDNRTRLAPDVLVALGRPKGYRGSYQQWQEGGIAPQVVFEVLSPGNRFGELLRKFRFYERFGVEEYFVYNPDSFDFTGWQRGEVGLEEIAELDGWVSPRLGVRFELEGGPLRVYGPDGLRFKTYDEVARERDAAARERDAAARERDAAAGERDAAARERDEAIRRADQLAQQLRALGVDPSPPRE